MRGKLCPVVLEGHDVSKTIGSRQGAISRQIDVKLELLALAELEHFPGIVHPPLELVLGLLNVGLPAHVCRSLVQREKDGRAVRGKQINQVKALLGGRAPSLVEGAEPGDLAVSPRAILSIAKYPM